MVKVVLKYVSLVVLGFALLYAMFEREMLRIIWATVCLWENVIVLQFIKQTHACVSNIRLNAILRFRMLKLAGQTCEEMGEILPLTEFDYSELKTQGNLCPKVEAIGTSKPWVVRNFYDTSQIDVLKHLRDNPDIEVMTMNKTNFDAFYHRTIESEYGRGCTHLRGERLSRISAREWYDLEPLNRYNIDFNTPLAHFFINSLENKTICGHDLEGEKAVGFVSRKNETFAYMESTEVNPFPEGTKDVLGRLEFPDTPPHCAADSNHNIMIQGRKKWVLVSPKYHADLGLFHDTITRNYVASSGFLVKCLPRYEFIMNPGDVLYIPGWWVHEVYNVPSQEEGHVTFGLATRWLEHSHALWQHPVQTSIKIARDAMYGRPTGDKTQNTLLPGTKKTPKA